MAGRRSTKLSTLNDFAKVSQASQEMDKLQTISKEEFERLKAKFNNTYAAYKKRLENSVYTPIRTPNATLTAANSGQWTTTTPSTATVNTTAPLTSGGYLTYGSGTYGINPNTYGGQQGYITTAPNTNTTWQYYIDADINGIGNNSMSMTERVYKMLIEHYGWTRSGGKRTPETDWSSLVEKFIPEVQSYFFYKKLMADQTEKDQPVTAVTSAESKAIKNWHLIIECMCLDYALVKINSDKEYIKKTMDPKTDTEWMMRLIFDSFSDMLREMVDRYEGTTRSVDYSYYTYFVSQLRVGINTIYGELCEDGTQG